MEFKDRLREARMRSGKTQKEIGVLMGWADDAGYRKYEAGKREPSATVLASLANALNVSSDWLLGLSSDPQIHSCIPLETKLEE